MLQEIAGCYTRIPAMKRVFLIFFVIGASIALALSLERRTLSPSETDVQNNDEMVGVNRQISEAELSITTLRKGKYPGSELTIEQTLPANSNYMQYIASYLSEGLKIYALLTIPNGDMPPNGWPAVVFNHGYIPPNQYRTIERYGAYVDGFARNGYIVLKPDYRGHGNSEGEAVGAYGSNAYTIDVLNALASIKQYKDTDPTRIGMWGHSLGGFLTMRAMVTTKDVKAGVIWAGVVGSYEDLLNNWRRPGATPFPLPSGSRRWRQVLIDEHGTPEQNPVFWNSLSATNFLSDISGPLQLHHGTMDSSVPILFSEKLKDRMTAAGKTVELFMYPGDDHNLSNNFGAAMTRSVTFFDRYLK